MMAIRINFGWPFTIYQGQQEFCISDNLSDPNQCRGICGKIVSCRVLRPCPLKEYF